MQKSNTLRLPSVAFLHGIGDPDKTNLTAGFASAQKPVDVASLLAGDGQPSAGDWLAEPLRAPAASSRSADGEFIRGRQ